MSEAKRASGRDADGTLRPWELPGNVRRDCAPHRGMLLMLMGLAALGFGFASVFLVVPALVAVPLGLATRRMARHDLTQMRLGAMDPEGRRVTVLSELWGVVAVFLSCLCWAPLALWYATQT
jgi:hypothetical protein